jgi:hypothetical protein
MTKYSVVSKPTITYGFTVDEKFYDWEVLEEISDTFYDYFFMTGSQEAEPLVKAGLATWSAMGNGSIRGTEAAKELYESLKEEMYALMDSERKN